MLDSEQVSWAAVRRTHKETRLVQNHHVPLRRGRSVGFGRVGENTPGHEIQAAAAGFIWANGYETLNKLSQILGRDDMLEFVPLLKSREKLHLQDKLWKHICASLQWPSKLTRHK